MGVGWGSLPCSTKNMLFEAILHYAGILNNFSVFLNTQSQWLSGMVLLAATALGISLSPEHWFTKTSFLQSLQQQQQEQQQT